VPFADSWHTGGGPACRKIRTWDSPDVDLKQLETARRITPIVSVQKPYNLENRKSEDVLKPASGSASPSFRGIRSATERRSKIPRA